jgi:hypothetical protein
MTLEGKRQKKRRGNRKAYRQTPQLRKQVYCLFTDSQHPTRKLSMYEEQ